MVWWSVQENSRSCLIWGWRLLLSIWFGERRQVFSQAPTELRQPVFHACKVPISMANRVESSSLASRSLRQTGSLLFHFSWWSWSHTHATLSDILNWPGNEANTQFFMYLYNQTLDTFSQSFVCPESKQLSEKCLPVFQTDSPGYNWVEADGDDESVVC